MPSDTLPGAEGRDDQELEDAAYGGRAEGARRSPPHVAPTIGGVVATLMQSPVTLARLPRLPAPRVAARERRLAV